MENHLQVIRRATVKVKELHTDLVQKVGALTRHVENPLYG